MGIVEDIGSVLTVQKDVVIRNGIVELIEGFNTSTMLGDCNLVFFKTDLVFFHQFLDSSGVGKWIGEVDFFGVMVLYYDVEGKDSINTTTIGVEVYAIHQGGCIFNVLTIIITIIDKGFNRIPLVLAAVWINVIIGKVPNISNFVETDV